MAKKPVNEQDETTTAVAAGGEPDIKPAAAPSHSRDLEEPAAPADPVNDLPWFRCEAMCPTPVSERVVELQAENAQEAEADYRRRVGLLGAVSGGISVTPIEK